MYKHTCQYLESSQLFHGAITGIMGTRFDMVVPTERKADAEQLWDEIVLLLSRLDSRLNRFCPQSELSQINAGAYQAPVLITPEMVHILQLCTEYHRKTAGYFDVTLHDFSKVCVDEQAKTVCFSEKISLDLGGFAKGYAAKHINQMVQNSGFDNAFIDFGRSSIVALGHHPYGDCWKVSVGNPFDDNNILDEFELRNMSLSTSGDTPTYSGHIINPFSGKFSNEKKMVCVVAPNALDAEVLSTVLMIAPDDEKEMIMRNFEIETKIEYDL